MFHEDITNIMNDVIIMRSQAAAVKPPLAFKENKTRLYIHIRRYEQAAAAKPYACF